MKWSKLKNDWYKFLIIIVFFLLSISFAFSEAIVQMLAFMVAGFLFLFIFFGEEL